MKFEDFKAIQSCVKSCYMEYEQPEYKAKLYGDQTLGWSLMVYPANSKMSIEITDDFDAKVCIKKFNIAEAALIRACKLMEGVANGSSDES